MNNLNKCNKCPQLVESRIQIVYGNGNKNADIMFIGICPGNHLLKGGADFTGIPFKGDKSGDVFEKMLKKLKLKREDVYTTNLVKCRPSCDNKLYNRLPTNKEIDNCLPYLINEINEVKPKIIIAFGKVVYYTLIENHSIDCPIKYIWHPSYIVRRYSDNLFNIWIQKIKMEIYNEQR